MQASKGSVTSTQKAIKSKESLCRRVSSVSSSLLQVAPKKLDYLDETSVSRLAAKARKLAGKLTPEEEAEHFRRGMAMIYGSQPKEITGAGH